MPNTETDTLAFVAYTARILVAFIIIPVRSKTPFAPICTSYSINSEVDGTLGGVVPVNAIRIPTAVVPLFKTFNENTEKVFDGTVYTAVHVVALKAACPNNPVAIVNSPSII